MSPYADWLHESDRHTIAADRIVSVAAKQIARHGLDRLNLDAVAREAGCSRATVYRHVGGKTAIVDAVLARNIAKVTADIQRAVQSADARRRAVVAITASLTAIRHDPVISTMIATMSPTSLGSYLNASSEIPRSASAFTGLADETAAQWISRVVMALLFWPTSDAAQESEMIERFVYPVLKDATASRVSASATSESTISPARTATFDSSEDDSP
ncbi:TetR/AcrR family transcriptional regulator [Mycobacteroides abscessus]|nr:TetR/AcrR family transcriptional regulator [Mycobacteroides abscessus]SIN29389.1 Putative transcriptional regulator, TetR family [Mycobacteroides abscessus subsp. abscessus]RIR38333.1 TetR/AcrR family transcriptional regulator [Mycobacteroides abscessus]RIR38715.1 TetR/AcrR family transcriptional regulator [Mycobacteroides abscessus]RIS42931.1 TetR/AcrR family transcriptional regulator [Mycobacteroides abscessus]